MRSYENIRNTIIALVVATSAGFGAHRCTAEPLPTPPDNVHQSLLGMEVESVDAAPCSDGSQLCVRGKLKNGVLFSCVGSTSYQQVICAFIPKEDADPALRQGIEDSLQEAFENGEEITI